MKLAEVYTRERAAAEGLASRANDAGLGIVTRLLTTAGTLAVAGVIDDDPPLALHRLRTSSSLLAAIEKTAQGAQRQAFALTIEAVIAGYSDDAAWRGESVAPGVAVSVRLTDADRTRLRDYPIQGHTAAEIAVYLATQLRYGIDGALASPLAKAPGRKAVPALLGEVGDLHATRLGNAVREAYFSGVKAATLDLGAALSSPMTTRKAR